MRPWKSYQQRFTRVYSAYLKKLKPTQARSEKEIKGSAEYQKLDQAMKDAEQAAAPRIKEIDQQVAAIDRRLSVLTDVFTTARSKVTSLVYELETTTGERGKASVRKDVEEAKKGPFKMELPTLNGGTEKVAFTYDELEHEFTGLKERKAKLLGEKAEVTKPASEARAKRDASLQENLEGLTEDQIAGLHLGEHLVP